MVFSNPCLKTYHPLPAFDFGSDFRLAPMKKVKKYCALHVRLIFGSMNKTKVVVNNRWMFRCKSWNCLRGLVSVKPYSEYVGLFATNGEEEPQIYLQIRIWTTLRSLRSEFFTVCKAMSTGVDITFFWVIVPFYYLVENRAGSSPVHTWWHAGYLQVFISLPWESPLPAATTYRPMQPW